MNLKYFNVKDVGSIRKLKLKTTKKDFEKFKTEFLKWYKILNLQDYKIFFEHKDDKDNYANIGIDQSGKIALVSYSTTTDKNDKTPPTPEENAKHEAIHLFLSRLEFLASLRDYSKNNMYNLIEGKVRVLEKALL